MAARDLDHLRRLGWRRSWDTPFRQPTELAESSIQASIASCPACLAKVRLRALASIFVASIDPQVSVLARRRSRTSPALRVCLEVTAAALGAVLGKPLLLLPTAPYGCGPPKRRTLQYQRARARRRPEGGHEGNFGISEVQL